MSETDGIVERPSDVIGVLDYEINKGGNSATVNAMIEARDALAKYKRWEGNAIQNVQKMLDDYVSAPDDTPSEELRDRLLNAIVTTISAALAEAVEAEREACWLIAHEMEESPLLSKIEQYRAGFIAATIRARKSGGE